MKRGVLCALLALALASPTVAQPVDDIHLVLKFVKADGAPIGPAARFDPASCAACRVDNDPAFATDNPRETILSLWLPRMRQLELAFDSPGADVRRVIVESGDLAFSREHDRIVVPVPPLAQDAMTAGEYAMHLVEPGMVLRLEHADPLRRAGAYAKGRFPTLERQAASNLEFAQRQVIRTLDLGERVAREGAGTIQIMGFDTNYPHGHTDAPPHMHMHMRWPRNTGTQIGHFYIGNDGLLTHNIVGIKGLDAPTRRFARGETFTTIGPDGRGLYAHMITKQGWLTLGGAGSEPCLIRPIAGGFQSGARVACPGHPETDITVVDDLSQGRVTVRTGKIVEQFRYDRDTGVLISPATPPASSPSVYQDGS